MTIFFSKKYFTGRYLEVEQITSLTWLSTRILPNLQGDQIGCGLAGLVFEAEHRLNHHRVAVKQVSSSFLCPLWCLSCDVM